jgi:hypothetical protein
MFMKFLSRLLIGALFVATAAVSARGDFSIDVVFAAGMADSYKSAFSDAVSFWESYITGYRVTGLSGLTIDAQVSYIDGEYGTLGSAGPSSVIYGTAQLQGDAAVSRVCYSTAGSMTFDSSDVDMMISAGSWDEVIRHEMAHVIGFGTLWGLDLFGDGTIYNDFYDTDSGQYTGAAGLAAYQAEFDPTAAYVPVELGGGDGTANGHWDEVDSGAGLTGIATASGDDMAYELMTGWLNSPTFLSDTTLGQFYDLGYTVVPEPASILLIALVCSAAFWIRRRFTA